jgi:hypothetical protein
MRALNSAIEGCTGDTQFLSALTGNSQRFGMLVIDRVA